MKFVACDFEGSHKNTAVGCPIQIGLAVMDGEEVVAELEQIIQPPKHWKTGKPTREIDAYALQVSGLTLEKIEGPDSLPSDQVCAMADRFITANNAGGLPVVTFNFSYDNPCWRDLLFNGGGWHPTERGRRVIYREVLHHVWICASSAARRRLDLDRYSLDDVAEYFGLKRDGETHGALMDAVLAGKIYHRLMVPK